MKVTGTMRNYRYSVLLSTGIDSRYYINHRYYRHLLVLQEVTGTAETTGIICTGITETYQYSISDVFVFKKKTTGSVLASSTIYKYCIRFN